MMNKLMSRKFWICTAAFLASLGTGISGLAAGHDGLATGGAICMVVSAAIYAACEAYVDGASLKSNQSITQTQTSISASSGDKTVVTKALNTIVGEKVQTQQTETKPE